MGSVKIQNQNILEVNQRVGVSLSACWALIGQKVGHNLRLYEEPRRIENNNPLIVSHGEIWL